MTDSTPTQPTAAQDLERLSPPATAVLQPAADEIGSEGTGGRTTKRVKAAGVFVTALVVGAIGMFTLQSSSASPQASNGPGGGFAGPPGANGQAPTGQQGQLGGRGVSGTVSAVSASSITVAGTTYSVTSSTRVIVNGTASTISAVKKGDTVFVHPEGSWAERVFVGSPPQGGPAGGPGGFGPPGQQNGQQPPANGSTSST